MMLAGGVSRVTAEIVHAPDATRIVFRRRDRWTSVLGALAFVIAWLAGGLFAIGLLTASSGGDQLMIFAWFAAWGLGGPLVFYGLIWRRLGVESLVARRDGLSLERRVAFHSSRSEWPAERIGAIEWLADDARRRVAVNGRRIPQPAIAVTVGGNTQRCASGISEAEARPALAAIARRLAIARGQR